MEILHMKKILTITLSLLLLLSTTACSLNLGFNSSKYELTAGHYDVPDDVPIGKYDIVVTRVCDYFCKLIFL